MASITKRGDVYRVQIMRSGKRVSATRNSRAEAEAWAASVTAGSITPGVGPEAATAPQAASIAALLDRYASEVSPGKGGARWEQIRLLLLARAFPGQVSDLNGPLLAKWRDKRLTEVSPSTVNRELNLLSAVFTRAMKEWGLALPANPVHLIQRPKMPPHRTRRVPDGDRAAVVAALGWDGKQPRAIKGWVAWSFCFALETMMRQGEVLAMTRRNVHIEARYVHLPKTKNGHARDVPLSSAALALLGLIGDGEPDAAVVPVNQGTFGLYFRRARREAGVIDLRFHDSRRESLTRISRKLSQLELSAASGHRSMRSLQIYYAPDASELADKMG